MDSLGPYFTLRVSLRLTALTETWHIQQHGSVLPIPLIGAFAVCEAFEHSAQPDCLL